MRQLTIILMLVVAVLFSLSTSEARTARKSVPARSAKTTNSKTTHTAKKETQRTIPKDVVGKFGTFQLKNNGKVYDTNKYDKALGGSYAKVGGAYFVIIETINGMPDYYLVYNNTAYNFVEMLSDEWADFMNGVYECNNNAEAVISQGFLSFDPSTNTITYKTENGTQKKALSNIPASQRKTATSYTE